VVHDFNEEEEAAVAGLTVPTTGRWQSKSKRQCLEEVHRGYEMRVAVPTASVVWTGLPVALQQLVDAEDTKENASALRRNWKNDMTIDMSDLIQRSGWCIQFANAADVDIIPNNLGNLLKTIETLNENVHASACRATNRGLLQHSVRGLNRLNCSMW
jgi:hypothetical protein